MSELGAWDETNLTPVLHHHWNWQNYSGGTIRWLGTKNFFDDEDFAEAFVTMKDQHRPQEAQTQSGLKKKKSGKVDFSMNVVQFVRQDAEADERSAGNFSQLTQTCKGQYQTVAGLDEIKSYVK